MARVLCLTNSDRDVLQMKGDHSMVWFRIEPVLPSRHSAELHNQVFARLAEAVDLNSIDVVFAEFVEAIPIVYLMRRAGYCPPAIFVPHTNPYPIDILLYFLAARSVECEGDIVVCGSQFAVSAYERLTGIRAAPIGTFGISPLFQPRPAADCRAILQLPRDEPIIVYTGRFARDKGIRALLDGWDAWRSRGGKGQLVICSSRLEDEYFNLLAPRLRETIFFHRLSIDALCTLYNAADAYVCAATSIFETYGKSHMEAVACGTRVVLPRFNGFTEYITPDRGELVDVQYSDSPLETPFDFGRIDPNDFAIKLARCLELGPATGSVPDTLRYEKSMRFYTDLFTKLGSVKKHRSRATPTPHIRHGPSEAVSKLIAAYSLETADDLLYRATEIGLIGRSADIPSTLLRALHRDVFETGPLSMS